MNHFPSASVRALLLLLCFEFVSTDQTKIEAEPKQTIILPCRAPDGGTIEFIEWSRTDLKDEFVLLYRNEKIDLDSQHPSFQNRVDLQDSQFKDGDVSLVLNNTVITDTGIYQCHVAQGNLGMKLVNTIIVHVSPPEPFPTWAKVLLVLLVLLVLAVAAGLSYHFRHYFMSEYKVEVEPWVESVLLPCKTRVHLPGDATVEWTDGNGDKVDVYPKRSEKTGKQHQFYSNRTTMSKNLLRTGDLSLTLEHPTYSNTYTCTVYNKDRVILMKKQVWLWVKFHQVEEKEGAESVELPFITTSDLPGEAKVTWWDRDYKKVHVYQNGSDQPEEQDQLYRSRTGMSGDPLKTGDLSLTLRRPKVRDSGEYRCDVRMNGEVLRRKKVQLRVKGGTVQVQPEYSRNSSTDPTPLLVDQSI